MTLSLQIAVGPARSGATAHPRFEPRAAAMPRASAAYGEDISEAGTCAPAENASLRLGAPRSRRMSRSAPRAKQSPTQDRTAHREMQLTSKAPHADRCVHAPALCRFGSTVEPHRIHARLPHAPDCGIHHSSPRKSRQALQRDGIAFAHPLKTAVSRAALLTSDQLIV